MIARRGRRQNDLVSLKKGKRKGRGREKEKRREQSVIKRREKGPSTPPISLSSIKEKKRVALFDGYSTRKFHAMLSHGGKCNST